MTAEKHIIQKLMLDLTVPDQPSAWPIQNRLSELCRNGLPGAIDRLLSDISSPERALRFDRLEIDLGDLSLDFLEEDFQERFERQLRNALDEELAEISAEDELQATSLSRTLDKPSSESDSGSNPAPGMATAQDRSMSREDHDLEIVLFFLETGALPWFALADEPQSISEKLARLLRKLPDKIRPALAKQLRNQVSRRRAFFHFDVDLLKKILFSISPTPHAVSTRLPFALSQIFADMEVSGFPGNELKHSIWDKAIEYAVGELPEEQAQLGIFNMALSVVASRIPGKSGEFLDRFEDVSQQGAIGTVSSPLVRHLAFLRQTFARLAETGRGTEFFSKQARRSQGQKQGGAIQSEIGLETFPRKEGQGEQAESRALRLRGPVVSNEASAVSNKDEPTLVASDADEGRPDGYEFQERQEQSHEQLETPIDRRPGFSLYVQNAGLVLFHPYLSMFFETLKLTKDGRFENDSCRVRAALVLQRLASAKPNPPEYLLPLNKILCGLDTYEPFPCDVPLTDNEVKECENLLETVVGHWPALKNTSAEGLRRSFVQREGVLEKEAGNWRLRVERKSFDLLLEKLPWGLSMIRLSWMKSLLSVEW